MSERNVLSDIRKKAPAERQERQGGEQLIEQSWLQLMCCAPVSSVTLQVNFPQKITFDMLYTNEFVIRVCSRALSILSEHTTI